MGQGTYANPDLQTNSKRFNRYQFNECCSEDDIFLLSGILFNQKVDKEGSEIFFDRRGGSYVFPLRRPGQNHQ